MSALDLLTEIIPAIADAENSETALDLPEKKVIPAEGSVDLINTEIIPAVADACLMRGRRILKGYDSHSE